MNSFESIVRSQIQGRCGLLYGYYSNPVRSQEHHHHSLPQKVHSQEEDKNSNHQSCHSKDEPV